MNKAWPKVPLAELLTPVSRSETVDALKEYRLLGIRLDGKGPFLRETLAGSSSSATKLFRVADGDFIYSRLFACRGAFGVIGAELDGCYVSSEFPTFRPVADRLDVKFLRLWFRLPTVIAAVDADCSGSTPLTRNRFKENFFLGLKIPLPPLEEQQQMVARIEELAAQIHEARTLRHQAAEEGEALLGRATSRLLDDGGWTIKPLGEILAGSPRNGLAPRQQVEAGGRGMLRINAVSSSPTRFVDMTAVKQVNVSDEVAHPFVVQNDDIFIVRYNGDINRVAKPAIYKGKNESRIVYPDKLMRLRPERATMTPDFLVFALSSRSVREQIEELGKTTAGNIGISGGDAKSFKVPLPPLDDQRRIVAELDALQTEVDALKRLQAETAAELDALLPAILDKAFKGEL
jgi:type I restriction enzyme S subunit